MIVSISWLKELVNLTKSVDEVINLLPLRTIGVKEVTDKSFELDMKGYNRADLLSMRGVAYEIAAITNSEVNFNEPTEKDYIWENKELSSTPVAVEDDLLCPVYCIAKISGLKVGPSPKEWVEKLNESGMRSVNNIADVTNLIMLEYGQPQHAFDAAVIKDETLVVRSAKTDEKLTTLDNKERNLIPTDLVIADKEKVVGLAGVMGGKNSEVTDKTTTILLEAAIFNPQILRATTSRLNLPSEASKRFQHGLTPKRLLQSLDAAIRLYQELGGKLESINITGNFNNERKEVMVSQDKISSLIGVEIQSEFVKTSLEKLLFKANLGSQNEWEIIPPYFRLDINIAEDVIEEVARLYGYETLPSKSLEGTLPKKIDQKEYELLYNLKVSLVNIGFSEIQTYSFFSTKVMDVFKLDKEKLIKVANPMSKETEYMRDNLYPNLLEKVADNLKNFSTVALFEVGKVYKAKEGSLPEENYHLSIALSDNQENTIQELQTLFQKVAQELKLDIVVDGTDMNEREKELFHPVRFYKLTNKKDEGLGQIAEIHPRITNKFGVENRVAILEIEI
ncbi:MAG: phenylalanine--tRNA ligase subunit beta [Candidatus Daviesbacteria bacterium]|nr:phenylalanine--tRNA ligase subunit beta [Candidatus Daviesbacteria bacterium]